MFEPVWLGNYIVPRWEAMAVVLGAATVAVIVSVVVFAFLYSGIMILIERLNK